MSSHHSKTEDIFITYPCYLCKNLYSKGPTTVDHVRHVHDRFLPKRPTGLRRPKSAKYTYVYSMNDERDTLHYGCSSCWFHADDIKELQEHVRNEHDGDSNNLTWSSQSESKKKSLYDTNKTYSKMNSLQSKEKDDDSIYDTNAGEDIVQKIYELGEMLAKLLKM